ncbi:amidohydrolase family protein [Gallaecimonas sp. GXIMD4217]|uniref:amidohydrolase family protein n=1 Tax=Gallaecimonas sp. GXIMD4217 TaxID=3131927 RepID=UPI00311B19F1
MTALFDFNYHLPRVEPGLDLQHPARAEALQAAIDQEYHLLDHDWQALLAQAGEQSRQRCQAGAHLMVLDSRFAQNDSCLNWLQRHRQNPTTLLVDFRADDIRTQLANIADAGARGIKFHPYLQAITSADHEAVQACASHAQALGLWISVDCSYGTLALYRCSGPELLAALLPTINKVPVFALHFGGPRILDVMMLALAAPNLYLDTSLSLSFWKGSTVDQDLAFAIGRLGAERFLFGTDQPFIAFEQAVNDMASFMDRFKLNEAQCRWLWRDSALSLMSRYGQ